MAKTIAKVTKKTTLLSWLFAPDLAQGLGKWLFRAALFLFGFYAFVLVFGTIGLQSQMPPEMKGSAIHMLIDLASKRWLETIILSISAYTLGMFVFMPRKHLDRTSFAAVLWTMILWTFIATSLVLAADKFFRPVIILPVIATIISITGVFASLVCYARKMGISKWTILLSFPFGFTFYEYSGLFLPDNSKEKTIQIKYNWYSRFIDFMLNTPRGQTILAAIIAATLAINLSPWGVFTAIFFGGIFAIRGKKWMADKINTLSIIMAAINTTMIVVMWVFLLAR